MNKKNVVSARFTPDELEDLRAAAEAEGSTISSYVRGVVGRAALLAKPGARMLRTSEGAPLVVWTNMAEG